MVFRSLLGLAVVCALLAGCGEQTDAGGPDERATTSEAPSPTASGPAKPACDEVWTAGATLAESYDGCAGAGAEYEAHQGFPCESGQTLFTFGERMYAVKGGRVIETAEPLKDDAEYEQALGACGG